MSEPFIPNGYIAGVDAILLFVRLLFPQEALGIEAILRTVPESSGRPHRIALSGENVHVFPDRFQRNPSAIESAERLIEWWRQTGDHGVRNMLFAGQVRAFHSDPHAEELRAIKSGFWASAAADGVLSSGRLTLSDGTVETVFIQKEAFHDALANASVALAQPKAAPFEIAPPPSRKDIKAALSVRGPGKPSDLKERLRVKIRQLDLEKLPGMTAKEIRLLTGEGGRTLITELKKEVLAERR